MTDEEREKLYASLKDAIDAQAQSHLRSVYINQLSSYSYQPYPGISPTDNNARGRYYYQEPEVDEQGTYYGYKILLREKNGCPCPGCSALKSPRYPSIWLGGSLTSDREPKEQTMFGIHCTKCFDHPELLQWAMYTPSSFIPILVKCALSGTIVETEQGFRAQHAQIIGVYENGHWQSYQDYKERSDTRSYPTPESWYEETKQEGWKRTYIDWDRTSNPHITPYP